MKKSLIKCIAMLCLTAVLLGATACSKDEVKLDVEYSQYYYSTSQQSFQKANTSYRVKGNGTFEFVYGSNRDILYGSYVDHPESKMLTVQYDAATNTETFAAFTEEMKANDAYDGIDIDALVAQISFVENLYYFKQYLFSSTSIQAYKYMAAPSDKATDYYDVEGIYVVENYDVYLKLSQGQILSQNQTAPEPDSYPLVMGTYSIENDFLVMTFTNANGDVAAVAKYLMARVSYPKDLEVSSNTTDTEFDISDTVADTNKWVKEINTYLQTLEGNEVLVLTNSFFSNKELK